MVVKWLFYQSSCTNLKKLKLEINITVMDLKLWNETPTLRNEGSCNITAAIIISEL